MKVAGYFGCFILGLVFLMIYVFTTNTLFLLLAILSGAAGAFFLFRELRTREKKEPRERDDDRYGGYNT
ncbi:hypothetical protein [Terribacillus sp. 7520-G]|uniref:hypothetical protein n=1 Tax=Terribacillus TaxID=459532 RepID=UPI000BA4EB7F|nr:hypothetical protein [Terribacillus sp. 7520-G]PAD37907.1 hypothetical protein CHH53_13675 [Terribacillus sp. 7520-G]